MPFSKDQKIFALIFIILFTLLMVIAYRSDAKINKIYYKNAWIVVVSTAIILGLLVFLIKITH